MRDDRFGPVEQANVVVLRDEEVAVMRFVWTTLIGTALPRPVTARPIGSRLRPWPGSCADSSSSRSGRASSTPSASASPAAGEIQLQLSLPGHELLHDGAQPPESSRVRRRLPASRVSSAPLERDHLGQDVGPPRGERSSQRRFERERRWILLEPRLAVRRRDADDRRPGSREHELGLTRPLDVAIDPVRRLLDQLRLVPGELLRNCYCLWPNIQRWPSGSSAVDPETDARLLRARRIFAPAD